ncbi:3140_t:CDS:2, partial [Ambispora gerdemannii]
DKEFRKSFVRLIYLHKIALDGYKKADKEVRSLQLLTTNLEQERNELLEINKQLEVKLEEKDNRIEELEERVEIEQEMSMKALDKAEEWHERKNFEIAMQKDVFIFSQQQTIEKLRKDLDARDKKIAKLTEPKKFQQLRKLANKTKEKISTKVNVIKESVKEKEQKILEVAEGDKQDCNYCSFSFRDFRFKDNLTLNIATHQVAAFKNNNDYADIAYICADCKKDFENDTLPYCELCDRLKRNRKGCFCNLLENKPIQSLSTEEITSRTFGYHLEKKTRELEKELSTAKEELNIEREERIKELEAENAKLKEENKQLKEQQNGQVAQIEVKENKR